MSLILKIVYIFIKMLHNGYHQNPIWIQVVQSKHSKKIFCIGKNVKINFIKDRPGHDIRYALNSNKIKKELNWRPKIDFEQGIKMTLRWYKNNRKYYETFSKKDILKRLGKND